MSEKDKIFQEKQGTGNIETSMPSGRVWPAG